MVGPAVTDWMTFLSPDQQCQSTGGNILTMNLALGQRSLIRNCPALFRHSMILLGEVNIAANNAVRVNST